MTKIIGLVQVKGGSGRFDIDTIPTMRRCLLQAWCQQHIAALM